jgi:hypothetical protein
MDFFCLAITEPAFLRQIAASSALCILRLIEVLIL